MKFIKLLILTLCLVPLLQHAAEGQGISLSPTRLFFTGNPGETVTQRLNFTNTSDQPFSFITRIQDFMRDSLGIKVYFPVNTQANSNGKWIGLSTGNVSVQPGEKKEVTVTLTIPKEVSRQTSSMVFFTQTKEQQPQKVSGTALGMNIVIEMGIQVYYTPKGLKAGELEFLSFDDRGDFTVGQKKSRRLALKIHNTGEINKDGFVRFELTNKETGEEIKIKPQNIAMLPDAVQWVILDLPADLKGKFLVVALLDAGAAYDLKVAEKEIIYRP